MGRRRSQERVSKKLAVSRQYLSRLAVRYKWTERLSAAMLEDRQIDVDAKAQAALEAARELERRKMLIQENAFALYEQFIEKARAMLQFPVETRVTTSETKEKRGKVIHQHITINPAKWTFMDAARMVATADTLARLGLGTPIGRHELTGQNGEALVPTPLAQPIINVIIREGEETKKAARLAGDAKPNGRA